MVSAVGFAAVLWVIAYLTWTLWPARRKRLMTVLGDAASRVHPGESWVVLAHALAFGSGYALGAANASFLLVLAVHHEVQYLYFTCAMARRSATLDGSKPDNESVMNELDAKALYYPGRMLRKDVKFAASFLLWPVIGFVGAVAGAWLQLGWLAPLGVGGLFCHYWLDGRIWTRRSFQTSSRRETCSGECGRGSLQSSPA
jgi:hypothetical protein